MNESRPPPRLRRQLAAELGRLRSLSGLSTQALATATGLSQAKVSRSERSLALPRMTEVQAWLDATGADAPVRDRVLALAEGAHSASVPWAAELADAPDRHLESIAADNESSCTALAVYQQAIVPGLLQTPPYTRALLARVAPDEDQDRALTARMSRQDLLYDSRRTLSFILTERAVRWTPDRDTPEQTRAGQHDRLRQLDQLAHVSITVLPDTAEAVGGFSSFNIYERDDDPAQSFVFLELEHGRLRLTDSEDMQTYRQRFHELQVDTLSITHYLDSVTH